MGIAPSDGTVGRLPSHRSQSLLSDAWEELHAVYRFRPLIRALVSSSLRTENVGTIFGYVWWLLDPLLLLAVYLLLFDVILNRGGDNFAVFIFTSIIAWKYFSAGNRNAMATTVAKQSQMRQVAFPKVVLPVATLLAESVRFAFALSVLVVFAMAFGIFPHPTLPLIVIVAAVQLVFTLALAFILSALNVFFRDVQHSAVYIFQAWFFLSPGLYPSSAFPPQYRDIFELNPFATILPAYHALILDHEIPDFRTLGVVAVFSFALLLAGYVFFVRLERSFAKVT